MLAQQPLNDLLTFIIVFLSAPYIKNPYLKGQLVEIMYYNTQPLYLNQTGSVLGDAINTNQLALNQLMASLISIYIGSFSVTLCRSS